jgi:amino acid transporter
MEKLKILGIGVLIIIFGIIILWFAYKTREDDDDIYTTIKGYGFGLSAVMFGALYVLLKLHIVNW